MKKTLILLTVFLLLSHQKKPKIIPTYNNIQTSPVESNIQLYSSTYHDYIMVNYSTLIHLKTCWNPTHKIKRNENNSK